jgi:WD40 repeat protein
VRAVAFTPDGKQLVSGGGDNTIRVWDVATEKELRVIKIIPENNQDRDKMGGQVMAMRLSSDGRIVYVVSEQVGAGSSKWLLSAWEVSSGKLLFQRDEQPGCPYGVFSPDGQRVVTARSIRDIAVPLVTDTVTGKPICSLPGVERLYFVPAFSSDCKLLAVLCFSGPQGCNARPMAPGDPSKGSHVHIFELATGTELRAWTVPDSVTCLAFSHDNRVLASSSRDAIRFWSVATGKELSQRSAHDVEANSLLFAPDGRTLAAALQDSTVLIWGLAAETRDAAMPAKELRPADLTALWADLASPDAPKGQAAVWTLAAAPRDSVPFLAKHLRPAVLPDDEQLTRWVADLDSVVFADREKATRELERQGEVAESRLRKALADNPSPEMRRRIEALLNKLQGPLTSPESLRSIRAIEVLEHISSPKTRNVLEALAKGPSEARLTREAQAALQRLKRLNSKTPER